ncbi:MAG TPA: endonuclease/exonuclease/phosphatase family protein [Blastocatellia bacterium]|nr:endonuclease/exonuclease/phosphatase family protein [Blastocatellia bacterium]
MTIFFALAWLSLGVASAQTTDVVLYASEAPVRVGNWNVTSDPEAVGGFRLSNPDAGAPKLPAALASPTSYFEMTFNAVAGVPYRLWVRGKAQSDYWGNDSIYAQFSGSVNVTGSPVYRIGTTSGADINLEDCSGCGLSAWGWQDNGWGTGALGPLVWFASSGVQTIRIQGREDGFCIDQIVLSPLNYLIIPPGALKNDHTFIPKPVASPPPPPPPPPAASDVVIWASDIPYSNIFGNWARAFDGNAAGQTVVRSPDTGAAKVSTPAPSPTNYFEVNFNAEAGRAYRLWIRGKALNDYWGNDSIYAQFSGSVTATGSPVYRIGTTSATDINLEQCSGCGLNGWGWQDNGWGVGVMGPAIYFASSGVQTLRVQTREDGYCIDQIVLSSQNYFNSAPGSMTNDNTILPSSIGGGSPTPPPPPPPPANIPPQVTISASGTSGLSPYPVNFTSNATDADGTIASYSWTFGEGHTSTQPYPTNIYMSAGTFTARLTVTDNAGATATASVVITVNAPAPPAVSTQLKVMSWNVAFGQGTDSVYNIDRTATYIANLNPDIAGVCEIPRYGGSDDRVVQLVNTLNQRTGRTWYWTWIGKTPTDYEGNLIVSKYPLLSTSFRYLSYSRSVAQATINVNGRTINFFATHLDAYSSSARYTEVNELKDFMSGFAESRIVVGDFNAGPDLSEVVNMASSYYDSWAEAMSRSAATAYADNPVGMHTRTRRGRIDYVFLSRGSSSLTISSAQVPDSRDLSNRNVSIALGTPDDWGVRPSDHNQMVVIFDVR